ncbi:MAG: energy transducer TonB [Bacteroidales bacterium]|jgi:protein TonB|nr:energy transducer TonB [Bacteroidales bacterium]
MNKRKNKKSDIDSKKVYFLEIGLIVALVTCLFAFEWKKYDINKVEKTIRDYTEDFIEVAIQSKHEVKPPPPKLAPISGTLLNIVKNNDYVDEDVIIIAEHFDLEPDFDFFIPDIGGETIDDDIEYTVVESDPEFPGGDVGRLTYLRDNVKYPKMAKESGIQGIVYVTFVVMPDGSISNVEVLRGIGGGCDEEAVRVVENMPKWKPGEQRGQKVKVRFGMQIKFTLQK